MLQRDRQRQRERGTFSGGGAGAFTAEYLVVAGGGAGGTAGSTNTQGGGGGAGGYLTADNFGISLGSPYVLTVGAGGAIGARLEGGGSGSDSVLGAVTAVGGGGGGSYFDGPNVGGSGGGGGTAAAAGGVPFVGATGTSGQGNSGGDSTVYVNNTTTGAGGGGGAAAAGADFTTSTGGGGGNGLASSITGVSVFRAAGGGGAGASTAGSGGLGGGGNGGAGDGNGVSGTVNTGSGGGGGSSLTVFTSNGGAGGSGVVIIRVPSTVVAEFSAGVVYNYIPLDDFNVYEITAAGVSDTVTFSQGAVTTVNESLRFNDDDTAYLARTYSASATNTKATFAFWYKSGFISASQMLYQARDNNSVNNLRTFLQVAGGTFRVRMYNSAATQVCALNTTRVFRDPSAWYHLVFQFDTTQATASDRVKLYVNGVLNTDFSVATTYPPLNFAFRTVSSVYTDIGRNGGVNTNLIDGYLADYYFIDGEAHDASRFGKQDADGIWQPISYTGSYGTNGFHLDFALGDGWSGLFDGSGDAITTPSSTNFSPGTGDFTFEFWINAPDQANKFIYDNRAAGTGPHITTGNSPSGALRWGNTNLHSTSKICDGTWHHAAVTRESGTIKLWVDGVLEASGSDTSNYSANNYVVLGSNSYAFPTDVLNGRLSNLRAVIGTAVYTANFTPPAAPLTAITNTQLLTFQDSTFVDNSANGFSLSVTGNVVTDKTSPFNTFADDTSGNGNDWTPVNFAADDVVSDTPSVNYATWNPLAVGNRTFANGNLDVTMSSSAPSKIVSTFGASSGKYYMEYVHQGNANWPVGISADSRQRDYLGISDGNTSVSFWCDSGATALYINGSSQPFSGSGTAWVASDIVGVALDADNEEVLLYKNGVLVGSAVSYASYNWAQAFFAAGNYVSGNQYITNFGQRPFAYTPPTGFQALSSANLPDPVIADGKEHFQPALYTGNGTTQAIGGLEFSPDFVWIKDRTSANNHSLHDTIRGANQYLFSSSTAAEGTQTNRLLSFNSNGFAVGSRAGVNTNSNAYVAWNWNAGGSTVTNTDGTITSQVRANTDAGISIVSYVGNGTNNATVGHGLGVAPGLIINKNRDTTSNWSTWHGTFAANDYIALNLTSAKNYAGALTNVYGGTDGSAPSSTVVKFGTDLGVNGSGQDIIMYCFAEVDGFSKFGSYTGNGSADGPFVYTGFRPAFVLVKRTDSTGSWRLIDSARDNYNVVSENLFANLSDAETSADVFDFTSNGFKARNTASNMNASGGTYIYMAFAENPFKTARAR